MGFKKKARLAQIDRWKKIKQAQLQDIEKIKKEEPEQVPEQCLYEAFQQCNFEPDATKDPAPELQQVIKTESIEIFHELLPPEELPAETPETPFCCLCLRIYHPAKFVQFSPQQSWNCLDVFQVQEQLTSVLGLQIDLSEQDALCRSCWALTELLANFRTCCRKAAEWRERFSTGIVPKETSREGWLKRTAVDVVAKTRMIIVDHVERIEQAEIEARNEAEQIVGPDEDSFQDGLESVVDQLDATEDNKSNMVEQSVEMVEEIREIEVHSCPNCEQKFEGKNGMIIHLHYCQKSAPNKSKKRFTCSTCFADFNYQKNLQDHLNKHKGIKPYKCRRENCNHHSYTVKERIHHEKICGKDKPICPECGLQLASPDTLKAHMGTHRAANNPCDICGKLFKSKITLKKHRLIHAEDRVYFPCSVCKKSLKSTAALRVHMRIHTQEKPHACHICGQGFAYKCLVKPHIKRCH
ncbi:zinc finger protein 394-like [Culex pipiens pallens]|uniref:zinc finger protein 394-like n=1 Tax=Culex pipiens pallens TaxID=42434 RepID=UPI001952A824|nr:zinc finger protein 394-like [Culex pipiens pallens]